MRILDVTSRVPWPPVDGARIVMHQLLRGLAADGHEVVLVALEDEGGIADETIAPVADLARLHIVPVPSESRPIGALRTLGNARPYTQLRRERRQAYDLIDRLHRERPFDLVIADQAHVATYGAWLKERYGVPFILRCHNIESEIYRRHLSTERNPAMRWYVALQTERWERFEREMMRAADACIAITDRDHATIGRFAPGVPVVTVPAAVDLDAFPYVDPIDREASSMIMLGNMAWPPNLNSVLWFAGEIWPSIVERRPDAVVHVVGDNPPRAQLPTDDPRFRIEGRVEEIAPYYREVTIGLVPLNVGGGMRVKMVEMMASGMPIVSTPQGAEGNSAVAGRDYVAAGTADEFARAVVDLLGDRARQSEIARSARRFVEETYSLERTWQTCRTLIDSVMAGSVRGVPQV